MSALQKISTLTSLIAEIGECDEINFALDGAIKIFTEMKTAIARPPQPTLITAADEDVPIAQIIRNKVAEKKKIVKKKVEADKQEKIVKKKVETDKLVFLPPKDGGKCGLSPDGKYILIPMVLMGCCGDAEAVKYIAKVPVPKVINKEFFASVAKIIKEIPFLDWDWWSFRCSVIEPNIDAIAKEMGLDEFFTDRVLESLFVVLNHWDSEYDEDEIQEAKEEGIVLVSHHTFFTEKDCEF